MAVLLEGVRLRRFIFNRLTADTGPGGVATLVGGRIYVREAPQSVALPAVVVQPVASVPTNTLGGARVFATSQADARVICDGGNTGSQVAIADRIDAVLQEAAGVQDAAIVVKLVRTDENEFTTQEAGKSYVHLVLTYGTPVYAAP